MKWVLAKLRKLFAFLITLLRKGLQHILHWSLLLRAFYCNGKRYVVPYVVVSYYTKSILLQSGKVKGCILVTTSGQNTTSLDAPLENERYMTAL